MAGDSKHNREETFVMQSDDVKGNLRQLRSESFQNSQFLSDMNGAIKIRVLFTWWRLETLRACYFEGLNVGDHKGCEWMRG
jgi:hypothetical protein